MENDDIWKRLKTLKGQTYNEFMDRWVKAKLMRVQAELRGLINRDRQLQGAVQLSPSISLTEVADERAEYETQARPTLDELAVRLSRYGYAGTVSEMIVSGRTPGAAFVALQIRPDYMAILRQHRFRDLGISHRNELWVMTVGWM